MDFEEYQNEASATAIYNSKMYPITSLMIEAAEVADIFTKPWLRGDDQVIDREHLASELGDVLWNLSMVAYDNNISLEYIALKNIGKLKDRQNRNAIMGIGDDR